MKRLHHIRWYQTIGGKLFIHIALAVCVINGYQAYISLRFQQIHFDQTIRSTALKLSDTIRQSIRTEMMENRKEQAYRIMKTIGEQEGIERVRIYDREGRIVFSTNAAEKGAMADKRTEACLGCHSGGGPRREMVARERTRIFKSTDGHRVLGMINPIYNEKDCSLADCHVHPPTQRVLGVIDITQSLSDVDRSLAVARRQIVLLNAAFIAMIAIIVVVVLNRFLNRPIKDLFLGTIIVANGELRHVIPVHSNDELGFLARSFNQMTEKLSGANDKVIEYMDQLEQRYSEKADELEATQAKLLQGEKLTALGKIVATVAHEINNPLTGVYTYIKLLQRKLKEHGPGNGLMGDCEKYLGTMGREVERTTGIVLNLLEFSRPKDPTKKPTDANELIEESLALIQGKLEANSVSVHKDIEPIPRISADPSQIKNVLINLMVNAVEAMDNGGTLTIACRFRGDDATIRIDIADTGSGIKPESIQEIFDPFFTTKGKGTGLGLSVANGIIQKHNGSIGIDSTVGVGTRMTVILPIEG
ncbi:MAG TPA: ATP-binding protein [Candidatus Deferrimicrobiaceae bacterium]|jgi:two-component system NtrC family sensor kinase